MATSRIILDTNVLVAGLRSRRGASFQVLSLIGTGRFEIALSVPLLFEYEDVLGRKEIGITAQQARDILDYVCSAAIHQEIHFLWRPFLKDPKDDLVLELAVASRCSEIVTFNLKDFIGIEQFDIRAIRPADFLTKIGALP